MIVLDLFQFQFDDSSITAHTRFVFDNDIRFQFQFQFDDSSITARLQIYLIKILDDGIIGY